MARILGRLPEEPRRSLLGSLAATVSPVARQKAELEAGGGLRRLLPVLEQLPDSVTVIVQPTMGWMMKADLAVIGPGRVLVISTCHWKGRITAGENDEWRGAGGIDLGRPDKRALYFAQRLEFSGHAAGYTVDPVVVFTDGPVSFAGPERLATFVFWDDAVPTLTGAFWEEGRAAGPSPDPAALVSLLGGK